MKECCNIPDRVIILQPCEIWYFNPWLSVATPYGIQILDITADAEWRISDTVIDYQWLSSRCCYSNVLL